MSSITDFQMGYFAKALGLTEEEARQYSVNDLRFMYYRDYDPSKVTIKSPDGTNWVLAVSDEGDVTAEEA